MESWKILLFGLILASLILNFASSTSAHKVKRSSPLDLRTFVMKFYEKFDDLNNRLDQMGNKTFDTQEIIANINHLITKLNDENAKKFEEKLKNIEGNFKKLNKMELILLELKNSSDKGNKGRSDDVWSGMTSLCEDKVATWANATSIQLKANLDRIDFCIRNEQKALNACHPNPCLHGGRCRLNSTESGYECDCLKFTTGIHCENLECSAEKRCFRYKDTLYVVIEANLTWAEAKVKCEGLNMTLAMPKDEESNRFLRDQLKPIYTTSPFYFLWIGIKRDEGMSRGQWAWVDGSALGEYTGGNGYMKSVTGSRFGYLYVDGDGSWMWYYRDAAAVQYYSICETRFSTN